MKRIRINLYNIWLTIFCARMSRHLIKNLDMDNIRKRRNVVDWTMAREVSIGNQHLAIISRFWNFSFFIKNTPASLRNNIFVMMLKIARSLF